MGVCFPFKSWNKKKKLQKLYDIGSQRIENELNIVKLMNSLRNLKIVLSHSIMNQDIKKQI
jgi:hypothetical protein